MKKPLHTHTTGFKPNGRISVLVMLVILSLSSSLSAQPVISATNPQFSAAPWPAYAHSGNDVWVNCDMLEYAYQPVPGPTLTGRLKAIVYGRHSWPPLGLTTESHVWVDDGINQIDIPLPPQDSATCADMVLAEIVTGSTVEYKVCVVYDKAPFYWSAANPTIPAYQEHQPYFIVYDLTGIGTGALGYSVPTNLPGTVFPGSTPLPNPYQLSPSKACGRGVHIDMLTDASVRNPYNGLPSTHYYGITWADDSLTDELYVLDGDLDPATGIIPAPFRTGIFGVRMPDVAALTEQPSTLSKLEIAYGQGFGLYNLEFDISTHLFAAPQLLEDSVSVFAPRIEAMSQYDLTKTPVPAKWQVNAIMKWVRLMNSTTLPPVSAQESPCGEPTAWQSAGYNNFTPLTPPSYSVNTCASMLLPAPMGTSHMDISAPVFFTEDIKGSCVAAGVSPYFNSNIGNQQYTVGFFPWQSHTSNYYERNINATTGMFVSSNYYEVSSGATVDYAWDDAQSLAISNSSNSGRDIWSAWYDGTDIRYKLSTPNTMTFRMAPQTGSIPAPFGTRIYPNPASAELHVEGAAGSGYRITDITGRELQHGVAGAATSIDIRHLAAGTYLLYLDGANGKAEITKFTKN